MIIMSVNFFTKKVFINGNNEIAWFLTGLKINETCPSRTLHKI